ncbi:hypothetical protein B0J17DRAFT_633724 [Rhizoctonia solani]|nr:hypothetical protein B0J17DRAFT_633724 [Rhizoctonia solani]
MAAFYYISLEQLVREYPTMRDNKTVDDSDAVASYLPGGIQYGPDWYVEPEGRNRFKNTLHTSTTSTSNLIYFFQGDAIHYYADRDLPHGVALVYIDGDQKGEEVRSNASSLQYQQLLWSKYNLGPGDHQIVISHAANILGWIISCSIESDHGFTPSHAGPAASSIPPEAVTVDDNDLTRVSYSAGWDPNIQDLKLPTKRSQYYSFHYSNTMHRTDKPGESVSFKFNGTAVWYYTDLNHGHGKVNITLDGRQSWVVNGDSTFTLTIKLEQQMLWNTTDLPYDREGLWATLDFFRYLPTQLSTPAPPKSSPQIGPIVGGVVGGFVLLSLCGIGYILHRRHTAKYKLHFEPKGSTGPPLINPNINSALQNVSSQPAWGYIPEPYHPPSCGSDTSARPGMPDFPPGVRDPLISSPNKDIALKGHKIQNTGGSVAVFLATPSVSISTHTASLIWFMHGSRNAVLG